MTSDSRALFLMVVAALASTGCTPKSSAPSTNGVDDAAAAGGSTTRTGCDLVALGLGAAKPLPAWQPPAGCTVRDGTGQGNVPIRSEEAFAARFDCADGITSEIDFSQHELIAQDRTLSPASTGGEIVDDGTTVTYVTHFRPNCPDDPRPMPMQYTVSYLVPTGATRTFADASCTVGPQRTCK